MTVKEAIKQLREQIVPNGSPASVDAIAMAIEALERLEEKEKEQALQEAKTSSNNKYSIKNDNTRLKECQEVIDLAVTALIEYYRDQLSGEEQKAWELGEVCRKVLDAQNLLEEEKQ